MVRRGDKSVEVVSREGEGESIPTSVILHNTVEAAKCAKQLSAKRGGAASGLLSSGYCTMLHDICCCHRNHGIDLIANNSLLRPIQGSWECRHVVR
mmetsp:Transcript_15143/g.20638  ORF Transcript_15143/g.20638 Transcript_15143/m.20638 type:complete len:96 (-) Transcript_15143:161-448(-)